MALFPPRLHTYHFHFGRDIAFGIRVIFSAGLRISWISYHQRVPFDIMNFWAWYERQFCVLSIEVHCVVHGVFSLGCVTTNCLQKIFTQLFLLRGGTCSMAASNAGCKWTAGTLTEGYWILITFNARHGVIDYLRQHQANLSGGRSIQIQKNSH